MPTAALIPIRSFLSGKDRLSGFLEPEIRSNLATRMAERTVTTAEQAFLLPVIVSKAPEVRAWALDLGLVAIQEAEPGLNSAAAVGATWAVEQGFSWIVLHSDLPLIQVSDLKAIAAGVENGCDAVAPSSDGGTSALSSVSAIEFAYGPGSFHRHLGQLQDPLIFTTIGTLHDVDSANDLTSAAQHPEGRWLHAIIRPPDD